MKKIISSFFTFVVFMAVICFETSAAEAIPKENSWRYKDGEAIAEENAVAMIADPYHPDATFVGIDVSHHQGEIDWEKVSDSEVDFAIIRCGFAEDNTDYDDRCWEYNASECERLGIPYGVYLYSYAENVEDAVSEAEHVLRLIDGHNLSLPVYYDLEENSMLENQLDLAEISRVFCDKISKAGYPVGIYANYNWWTNYLTDDCFDNWYRWVARWNISCEYDKKYAIWQYYNKGQVDGIDGDVDMNYLIGTPDSHKIWSDKLDTPQVTISNSLNDGKPKLSWNSVEGAQKYQVWRKTEKQSTYRLYSTTQSNTLTDQKAVTGVKYSYRVKAVTDAEDTGDSCFSEDKIRTCDLPRPVVKVSNIASTGKIKISWDAVEGADKYEVYRATSKNGEYKLLTTTAKTSVTNTKATAGITYYYKVRAIYAEKTAANSAYSTVLSRTCDLPRPDVEVTLSLKGKPKLSWDAVEKADRYEVYRATSKDGKYSRIITTVKTGMTNTSAVKGKRYYYKVRAVYDDKTAANSAYSTVVNIVSK